MLQKIYLRVYMHGSHKKMDRLFYFSLFDTSIGFLEKYLF